METLEWIEKNKENSSIEVLEEKMQETEAEIRPILDNMFTKINEANQRGSIAGSVSARSKIITPQINK